MKKNLPIGMSDYQKLIEGDYYYIDKTLLIKEILKTRPEVLLLPRPRRFGKTLNLSMLRYFFEKSDKGTRELFNNTAIEQDIDCMKEQGQYPVIFVSFKDVKKSTWEGAHSALADVIALEFQRHDYLLQDNLLHRDQKAFSAILEKEADCDLLSSSLFFLSRLLHDHYKKPVVILIDEYDAPITAGYNEKYYKEIIDFMRSLLTRACKDNNYLYFAVLTGILRVAKESIFSGLNNAEVHTVLSEWYQDKFGFTEQEVQELLENQELTGISGDVKAWYDGYLFGKTVIYNPWSILQCARHGGKLAPYWVNTSDNALIELLLARSDQKVKEEFERLLANETIETGIEEATVFPGIERNTKAVWSLLLFAGYLSVAGVMQVGDELIYQVTIPNKEIKLLYVDLIKKIFQEVISTNKSEKLLLALTSGDSETLAYLLQEFVESSMSMFDFTARDPENSYHLFILGMLVYLSNKYEIKSNRESGYGRYDIMVIPRAPNATAIVIEFKKVLDKELLKSAAQRAIEQIQQKNYVRELHDRGITNIVLLGIAFRGKELFVASLKNN